MKNIIFLGFALAVFASPAFRLKDSDLVMTQEQIDYINQSQDSWTASPDWVGKMTIGEAKQYATAEIIYNFFPEKNWGKLLDHLQAPSAFDARQKWPSCIHPILNQGDCGSCWAFGASEALSDRLCIFSNNTINVVLSPQYLVNCDTVSYGCGGGYAVYAWYFMQSNGIPTQTCTPYAAVNQVCAKTCSNGSTMQFYKAASVNTFSTPASIQAEVLQNGPIEVTFQVYQDFYSYSGGVYKHTTGSFVGNHSVKIVGWGAQGSTNYWIVANSWGNTWGMSGFFWIAFGECGIDSNGVAGLPAV